MIEVFDGLSVAGDPVSDEDRTVHLLASLPESYNMLMTACSRGKSRGTQDGSGNRTLTA